MYRRLVIFILFFCCCNWLSAQDVFNPADTIINYDSTAAPGTIKHPLQPAWNTMAKWVRTPRETWNTSNFKCYIWNGMQFRLRFPNNYKASDSTKYPVIVFYHGGGDTGRVYENDNQLIWGAQPFEQRINNGEWNGFMIFPQVPSIGWNDYQFSRINSILDTLQKYNHADPDRVIAMGLSAGGYGALSYTSLYPQRVAATIAASPIQSVSLTNTFASWLHIPVWFANGGQDKNPDPANTQVFYNSFRSTGGNIYQTYFVNIGHDTWTYMWNQRNASGNFITDVYWNNAHKAQPLVYFQNQQFCGNSPIAAKMGISAGFYAYEWQQNGVTIPGANGNEYTASQPGQYRVRFMRVANGAWSAWSPNPVVISTKTCAADTLFAEHFNSDNGFNASTEYHAGNFGCQNGIVTSSTDVYVQDASGVQGNRFLVNFTDTGSTCAYKPGDLVWGGQNAIAVTPNTNYEFSFYTGCQNDSFPAKLVPVINGVVISTDSSQFTVAGKGIWKKCTYTWNSGTATTALPGIINRTSSTKGNDFAIDEISLRRLDAANTPLCTTNLLPANGSTDTAQTSALLKWHPAAGTTAYNLYLWANDSTPPAAPLAHLSDTIYNIAGLRPATMYKWYVVPENANGAATGCDIAGTTSFTTAAAPPPVPGCAVNNAPANGATLTTQTTATLTWNAAANASSYDVYVWTGSTVPASPVANTTANSYNVTGLTASTLCNWLVVPKNASGSAAGCGTTNTTSFTTAAAPPPIPGCAINSGPANGATVTTQTTATLTWNAVANASSYDVYVWTGSTVPASPSTNTTETSYSITGLTASTLYNWFVVPKNASGAAAGCAATNISSFTTAAIPVTDPPSAPGPVPPAVPGCAVNSIPANGAALTTQTTATLTWAAAANASSYDVYVWTGATVPASPSTNTTETSYSVTGLTASTLYNWFVVPKNASGAAAGCAATNISSFTTAAVPVTDPPPAPAPPPVPGCVVNSSPANGAALATQTTATLTWAAAANASSYDVYVWTGSTVPASPTSNTTETSYSITGLTASTLYNWFVVPKNASGAAAGCSATNISSFTTAAVPVTDPTPAPGPVPPAVPGCAINSTPANGATLTTQTTATLTWAAAANASSYDVYVWTGATVPASPSTNTTETSYSITGLTASTLYNWFVVPKNASGAAAGCAATNISSFTTASIPVTDPPPAPAPPPVPGCAVNSTPANGATLATQTTATLTWVAAANASSYDVYVWTGSTVPASPTSNTTETSYSITGLIASTLYNWFVVPKNASGSAAGCAATNTGSFTTAAVPVTDPPPAPAPPPVHDCAVNSAPANGAILATQTTATLTWTAVANASSYDVYVWTGATVPASPSTNTTETSYSVTGLTASTLYNWFVVPKNASGAAAGCSATNISSFTTAAVPVTDPTPAPGPIPPAVPGCAVNNSPANGATLTTQTTATLTWAAAANASSYDVYVWTGATVPASPSTNTTETSYSVTGLTASTLYNWFVVPKNTSGAAAGCAATNISSFTTASIPVTDPPPAPAPPPVPGCAVNSAPANGATLATQTTATLTWTAVANASSYDVYVWTGSTAPALPTSNTTETSYSITRLTASTLYNWFVVPKNASGAATGCSATSITSFTTAREKQPLPGCVTNILPLNVAIVGQADNATLVWSKAAGADSYDVYLWTGTAAPTTAITNTTDTSYRATGLSENSLYSWYIVPKNASGAATGCNSNLTVFKTAPVYLNELGEGLQGDYYNHLYLSGHTTFTRIDSTVNFNWGTGSPILSTVSDVFTVRWTGRVLPLYSEKYTFYTVTNAGARLWVNGKLLIDNWQGNGLAENSDTMTLMAGKKYDIKMEYHGKTGSAIAKLLWSGTSTPKEIIPQSQLYLPQPSGPETTDSSLVTSSGLPQFTLFPNPVTAGQTVTLRIDNAYRGPASIQLINTGGNQRLTQRVNVNAGLNTITVPTMGLRSGLYVLYFIGDGNKITSLKLVVN